MRRSARYTRFLEIKFLEVVHLVTKMIKAISCCLMLLIWIGSPVFGQVEEAWIARLVEPNNMFMPVL